MIREQSEHTLAVFFIKMGSRQSVLEPKEIEDFTELTFFSKQEVLHCFARFRSLSPDAVDENPLGIRFPLHSLQKLPELQFNPFADRFVSVFSSREDDCLGFEDFLDMASVMSEYAPPKLKADWAFKIFDFDDDDIISDDDVREVIRRMSQTRKTDSHSDSVLTTAELEKTVKYIMSEADLNKSGSITPQEFNYIMSKSPDFAHNFRMRL